MSKRKKIFLTIFGIILVVVIGIIGFSAKVYFDVANSFDRTYEKVDRTEKKRTTEVNISDKEPFSVLLLGIDTGDLGRTEQGRSDTMLVATVNPQENKTVLVSLARDTYAEIVGYGTEDKINHAYAFGGAAMSMDTVQNLLDIPIDHYVTVNMSGLKELVDAVGGVNVNNEFRFTYEGTTFDIGKIHLNGEDALKYSRMRYEDPNGDYGRQERQRKVIAGIVNSALSIDSVTKYQTILDAMENNMKTDLSFSDMQTLALDYRSAFGNLQQEQLQGEGMMLNGISYQEIEPSELERIQTILKDSLDIK